MIKVNRKALIAVAERCSRIAEQKHMVPILGCMRLELKGDGLHYRATDLVMALSGSIEADGDPQAFCINARELSGMLGTLDGDTVKIEDAKTGIKLTASGKRSVRIATVHADEFPQALEEPAEYTPIPGEALRKVVGAVLFSVAPDIEQREQIKLVRVSGDGELLTAVSADGHRLTQVSTACAETVQGIELPKRAAAYLAETATEEIGVGQLGSRLFFRVGNETLAAQSSGALFPPYQQLVPNHDLSVELPVDALRGAFRSAARINSEVQTILELKGGAFRVRAESKDDRRIADMSDEIEVEHDKPFRSSAACRYLDEAVANCPIDTVTLRYGDELDPILFTAPGYLALVMPMKI